jgi:hypothetical protein
MNATAIAYITFTLGGIIIGMIIQWFLLRSRIQVKQIHIDKPKVKGQGNVQDLDVEESETLKTRKQLRQEKRAAEKTDRRIKEYTEKQAEEIKIKVDEALKQSDIVNKLKNDAS